MTGAVRAGGCRAVMCVLLLCAPAGCEREARPFQDQVAAASAQQPIGTDLYAGAQPPPTPEASPFQENAYGISEGKRLFGQFNCTGCHAHGGGGMGPPLMDSEWIYGARPANIFASIVEGRPNGMPSWAARIPDTQVWQLVAYVQSMSGNAPVPSLPGRSDHMRYSTPENARRAQTPVQTGTP